MSVSWRPDFACVASTPLRCFNLSFTRKQLWPSVRLTGARVSSRSHSPNGFPSTIVSTCNSARDKPELSCGRLAAAPKFSRQQLLSDCNLPLFASSFLLWGFDGENRVISLEQCGSAPIRSLFHRMFAQQMARLAISA